MPQRETCEVSASGSDQVKPNDLDAGLTVEGLSLKESRRPEGVADEEYTVEELMMSEDSLEDCNLYRYGGYHPVHLGDSLGDDARYRVLHKIGSGLSSTVWLCRDTVEGKYVALKIIMADKSKDSPELNSLKLKDVRHEESGGDKIAIPEDHFWTEGPNGTHLCLVLPVLGPRVPDILALANNPLRFSKSAAIQVVEGLEFLHRKGICHGGELHIYPLMY